MFSLIGRLFGKAEVPRALLVAGFEMEATPASRQINIAMQQGRPDEKRELVPVFVYFLDRQVINLGPREGAAFNATISALVSEMRKPDPPSSIDEGLWTVVNGLRGGAPIHGSGVLERTMSDLREGQFTFTFNLSRFSVMPVEQFVLEWARAWLWQLGRELQGADRELLLTAVSSACDRYRLEGVPGVFQTGKVPALVMQETGLDDIPRPRPTAGAPG